jgi:hypothetical protein
VLPNVISLPDEQTKAGTEWTLRHYDGLARIMAHQNRMTALEGEPNFFFSRAFYKLRRRFMSRKTPHRPRETL